MPKKTFIIILLCIAAGFAQDEVIPQGTFSPFFFAELLDVEIYSPNIAYVVGVGGFVFMDISNLTNPSFIGRYDPGNIYIRFYNGKASGNLAIGAARFDGLYFIDISNLSQPTLYNHYSATNFSYESVDFQANYAYAAAHQEGVEVLDIASPANPVRLQIIPGLQNAWDVFVDTTHLYVADGAGGLKIYSLLDPGNPQLTSSTPTTGHAKEVVVQNNIAYVVLGASGVDIIDVSDPNNPVRVSNFSNLFGIVNHISIENGYLFAATWELILVVDVSVPSNPTLVATEDTPTRAMGVEAIENKVLVADWNRFKTYTFSNNNEPDIHVKPTVYDFGYQGPQNAITKQFQIYNLGETDLQVENIGINHPQFSVSPTNLVVPPNSMQNVDVSFIPTNPNYIFERLIFHTNDTDELTKEVEIFAGESGLAPGDTAPNFNLRDLGGVYHDLSSYRGKIVILAFFASW